MSSNEPRDSGQDAGGFVYEGDELALFEHAVHWKSYFARKLTPHVRGDVLEVGAGIGGTTRNLCDGSQTSWVALEPDPDMAAQMQSKLGEAPLSVPVEVVAGTLADLPAERKFDTILYIDVLEHIEGDRAEMELAAARLKPGGSIVVLSPAHQWLFTAFDAGIGHFRRYNARSLRAVTPDGLEEERMIYLDSVGMLASLGNRMLLSSSMPTPKQLRFWDSVLVRMSRWVDPILLHKVGKTIVGVWRKPG